MIMEDVGDSSKGKAKGVRVKGARVQGEYPRELVLPRLQVGPLRRPILPQAKRLSLINKVIQNDVSALEYEEYISSHSSYMSYM